ncbi:uncharacterized protein PHACADRAFT_182195 [Phanerochaete carnosa HHB-10118-sp]|uniref:Uncharacterized protein n=1 Tax=Phanerochaete carnosa (strain HHB-10118-sp) TaxID=650164 RepID=K5W1L3_PHACS|nr:uncharacterized protein PHACADRAFT_182195 [Phanerochaete carnosa HHB-10118-sp]EKM57743.1 hypothetical protein PHACADRAFT_182195 [Phanerochaete carnosa HHB-10118-sp]
MTEYDWSPEAWERHLENQQRVSNWVTDQSARLPKQQRASSVAPSYPTQSSHQSSSRHNRRSSSTSPTSSTPTKARPARPEHKRSYTEPVHEAYRSSRPSRSRQISPQPVYQSKASPTAYASQTYIPHTTPYVVSHDKHGGGYRYQTYSYDATSGHLVLPPPRSGEQYIIMPSADRKLVVVNNDPYTVVHQDSRSSSHSSSSKNQPLLKRLFTSLSPSRSSGSSTKLTRHTSRDRRAY